MLKEVWASMTCSPPVFRIQVDKYTSCTHRSIAQKKNTIHAVHQEAVRNTVGLHTVTGSPPCPHRPATRRRSQQDTNKKAANTATRAAAAAGAAPATAAAALETFWPGSTCGVSSGQDKPLSPSWQVLAKRPGGYLP